VASRSLRGGEFKNMEYPVIIGSVKDGTWVAECLTLDCTATGSTKEEALENIEKAINKSVRKVL
jgi:predicted RNase H-like HicB family nuclease